MKLSVPAVIWVNRESHIRGHKTLQGVYIKYNIKRSNCMFTFYAQVLGSFQQKANVSEPEDNLISFTACKTCM